MQQFQRMEHHTADDHSTPANFHAICRICAGVGLLSPIINQPLLTELLNQYLSIRVLPTDRLPQQICPECRRCVLAFHQLHVKCVALQARFQDQLTATATTTGAHRNRFACPFCNHPADGSASGADALFDDKALLQAHLRDRHSDRIFHCDVCAELVDRQHLMEHMTEHARRLHASTNDDDAKDDTVEGGVTTAEAECDVDASRTPNLNATSSSTTSSLASERPAVTEADVVAAVAFNCADCERCFATSGGLRYHRHAVHQPERRFGCDRCPAAFASKRVLENHVRGRHSSERAQRCDQCPKTFKTDTALWLHRRRLHPPPAATTAAGAGSTDFGACDHCGKSFRTRAELVRHLASHSDVRRLPCPYCSKRFAVRDNLTKHLRTHTALTKEWRCHICAYAGAQRRYLAGHMRSVHQTVLRGK